MNTVEHLTKIYGDQRAVDDLSFDVQPGRLTRLVTVSARSMIARGCGLWLLARARRSRTA